MIRLCFRAILGILLLHFSSVVSAFTIIEIPDPESTPSNSVTDSTTFNTELQPITSAIQTHLRDVRRRDQSNLSARRDNLFASNSHAETMSDAQFIKVSSHSGSPGGGRRSLWMSTSFTALDNDFSRTKYDGGMHMLLVGFDYTMDDRYIFGVALSHEASDIDTVFNTGNQETSGISINPYFAYIISDSWSVDLSLGFGDFDTEQFRSIGFIDPGPPIAIVADTVDSDFSTDRDFIASNLTYSAPRGNWFLSGWLGFLVAEKDQDDYTESDGTPIKGQELDIERWNLGGEAAYQHSASETYVGLLYEKDSDFNEVEFAFGEQPENDDDSMLFSVGWRYYGDELVANIEFASRLGVDDISENSISSTLRIDL